MSDLKLKPCPFCGGKADKETWVTRPVLEYGTGWIGCRNCRCYMKFTHGDYGKNLAIEAWNRRVYDDEP